jgi:recombination protein RecR
VDGATTAHWLTDRLRPFGVTISRVGQGVPIGGALDVLDDGTLAAAVRGRRPV